MAAALLAGSASAYTSFCSNPARAGIRRQAHVIMPWARMPALKRWLDRSSDKMIGMSLSSVESQPAANQPIEHETLILQSPKFSVDIHIEQRRGDQAAIVRLERTCISDALEPWSPYWRRFSKSMAAAGFLIRKDGFDPHQRRVGQ